ncbi:hypothetical protein RQP46_002018 [Phenoliferia psychrophenolica]
MTVTQRPAQASAKPTGVLLVQPKGDLRNHHGISTYTQHWDKDSAKDTPEMMESRKAVYTDVVNSYYDDEHYLAAQGGIKPKSRVLDVGCGIGGPAREIAQFTDATIIGVNNNAFQVDRANKRTVKAGLADRVSFVKGDFMQLVEQFGENSFDHVYAIEATCHAPDWEGCYDQIRRVLKPGGTFMMYEWCMTDIWDPKKPSHKDLQHRIEVGDGIPEMRSIAACRTTLQHVGFEILHEEDLSDRDDAVPWYYPLEGKITQVQTLWDVVMCWRMTTFGKWTTANTVWCLEKFGLVPGGTHEVGEALKVAANALVASGQQKLFTPMMLFVCRKPSDSA